MEKIQIQAMSRLPLGHLPSGIACSASTKSLLLGFCLVLSLLTGCLETLDEAINNNESPAANAGKDQKVTLGGEETTVTLTLDGSRSKDSDGKIVTYMWTVGKAMPVSTNAGGSDDGGIVSDDGGTEEGLETPDPKGAVKPTVTLGEGVHTFHLWVTDNDGATSMDTVVITVSGPGEEAGTMTADQCKAAIQAENKNATTDCMCEQCLDSFGPCLADAKCQEIMLCAAETGCSGTACVSDPKCGPIISSAYTASPSSVSQATTVGTCAQSKCAASNGG
jgi:hypothetical protein